MKQREKYGLKRLADWGDEVTLVPYSGIQMLDFGFDLEERRFRKTYVEKPLGATGEMVEHELEQLPDDREQAERIVAALGPNQKPAYPIDARKALEPFLGKWVPVPVLRLKKERGPAGEVKYDPGPSAWARARVVELGAPDPDTGHTHRVQLALDTTLIAENLDDRYLAPERADAENPHEFSLVSDPAHMGWFLRRPAANADGTEMDLQRWVSDWIKELYYDFLRAQRPGKPLDELRLVNKLEHWSRYLTYLALLETFLDPPRIRFINTVSQRDAVPPVKVDLVLDIGNSRTCGILIEQFPGQGDVKLTNSYPLEVRDLSRPEFSYEGLLESRVEFAEQSFGDERFASGSGRRNAFLWPSFVRVGPEAMRLIAGEEGTETISGLSSPKRYLWDDVPMRQDWRFHNHNDPNNLPRGARAAMQYLNEAGDVIEQVKQDEDDRLRKPGSRVSRAIRPRFSRSSLFGFMLSEILAHALIQVNEPASRARRAQSELPRQIGRIILTLPTATPVQEQAIIRSRANGALRLLWNRMGMKDAASNISKMPETIVDWDEASCTQLVYLYSEITQRFEGRIDDYIALKGRPRPGRTGGPPEPSLRLACIDVGGGTTDLMVTTFYSEANTVLHPVQTFREGFRVAGDDLVQRIISGIILPQIIRSVEAAGGRYVVEKMSDLFGGGVGGRDQQVAQKRTQFALRVLRPLATAIIEAAEEADELASIVVRPSDVFGTVVVEDDYGLTPGEDDEPEYALDISPDLLDYLEGPVAGLGAAEWTLFDFMISCGRGDIDGIVREVFQNAIGNMVEVIDHLQTDIILLTGRPSRLPSVRALVEEMMAVPPDRLVSMHRYRTDTWYPYRDPVTQRIGDPKSTVAVGGMLIALAGGRVPNFKVTTDAFRMKSTARYIGQMDTNGQIKADRVLFGDLDLDKRRSVNDTKATLNMYAPVYIGSRQLPLERWTTTPLYRFDFANEAAQNHVMPVRITLERSDFEDEDDEERPSSEAVLRRESLREEFGIYEITDGDNDPISPTDVKLQLHTLGFEDTYWLDTGEFKIR